MAVRLRRWPAHSRWTAPTPADRPRSQLVATFPEYDAVERAVDLLVARGFGSGELSVTGEDLRLTEPTTESRAATVRVALLGGTMSGGLFGVLLALVFGFVGITDPIVSAGVVTSWGAVAGGLIGLGLAVITWSRERLTGRRRAWPPLEATTYSLCCHSGRAAAAQRLLTEAS